MLVPACPSQIPSVSLTFPHYSAGLVPRLEKTTILQVVFDDDIGDGIENELHVLGVGGAREMCVDLLGVLPLVQVLKLTLDVA